MKETMCPCVIIGAGGHARVLLDLINALGWPIAGCISPSIPKDDFIQNCSWLGDDTTLTALDPDDVVLANGLGSINAPNLRRRVYNEAHARGFNFPTFIHPTVTLSNVDFMDGVQIMAGAVLQPRTTISQNVLINTGVIVDHDCKIGAHSHVAPGVTLSGSVNIGSSVHVGTGAVVMQGISIGDGAVIGAGSVVIHDVNPYSTVVGNPARLLKRG